ncbi:MAG TPA: hypothetical protein VG474_05055 [Solirubrobacteraceae bacterium]|nr:hypothetical protein [Solirubrobacteraceae bacterium]
MPSIADARLVTTSAPTRLRQDPALANRVFADKAEAFNAGLAIGVAAARRAAARGEAATSDA